MTDPYDLGLEQEINRLVDPNPLWPQAFAEEAARIRDALGEKALAIEHYGSTAVPGLRAKPIIDLQIGGDEINHGLLFIEPMAKLAATTTLVIRAFPSTIFSANDAPEPIWRTSWSIRGSGG